MTRRANHEVPQPIQRKKAECAFQAACDRLLNQLQCHRRLHRWCAWRTGRYSAADRRVSWRRIGIDAPVSTHHQTRHSNTTGAMTFQKQWYYSRTKWSYYSHRSITHQSFFFFCPVWYHRIFQRTRIKKNLSNLSADSKRRLDIIPTNVSCEKECSRFQQDEAL